MELLTPVLQSKIHISYLREGAKNTLRGGEGAQYGAAFGRICVPPHILVHPSTLPLFFCALDSTPPIFEVAQIFFFKSKPILVKINDI